MQEEAASAQRELDRALKAKLREHSELLQRGFSERAALIEQELAALRREIDSSNKQELAASAFNAVRAACELAAVLTHGEFRGTAAMATARRKTSARPSLAAK